MRWMRQKRRARAGPWRLGALVLVGALVALAAVPAQALTVSATLSAGGQSVDWPASECYSHDSDFFKITNTSDTPGVELTEMSLTLYEDPVTHYYYFFDITSADPGHGGCQDYGPRLLLPHNVVTDETCSTADGSSLLTLTFGGATLGQGQEHWFGIDVDYCNGNDPPWDAVDDLTRGKNLQGSSVSFSWTYGDEKYTGSGPLVLGTMTGSGGSSWDWSFAEVIGSTGSEGEGVIPEPTTMLLLGGALVGGLGACRRRRRRT